MAELGFINVPIAPSFIGIAGQLNDKLIKPARDAGKKAASEVEKSVNDSVKSLERQVAASTKKLNDFDRAREDSTSKRKAQQDRLNAAIAEQAAAEEKYQDALKKGKSGLAEQAKVEKARAKVTDETIKLTKAERDITDAEQKHKSQLEDLQRTTEKYQQAQLDLNNEVSNSKGTFGGLKDSFSGLKDQVSDMGGPLGGVGDLLESFKGGPAAGVMAIAGALGTAAGAAVKFSDDLAKSRVNMQNQFGLSADAARDMQGEIADAMGSGMGDYEETALAVTQINQVLGDEIAHMGGQTAAQLSDDFMAFNQTFQRSAEETASTIDVMLNSGMVSNAQEGLDLLTAGMQKVPAAMQDEVFDAMNEYSKHFNTLGIDGADAMAMLVAASENGQYAIDKTGDAIKEFSLRGSDMSKTSTEAYDLIGLSAGEMASKIAAGGEGAQEALKLTAEGLLGIEDPAERANAAIALFGTPVEDLGVDQIPTFLESLTAGGEGMGDFAGSAQTMADNTQNTFTGMFNQLKGNIHGWAIESTLQFNEWAGNLAQSVIDSPIVESVGDTLGSIKDLGSGVWDILFDGDYTGLPFGLSEDSGVVDFLFDIRDGAIDTKDTVVSAWEEIAAAFTGGDWGYGALAELFGEEGAEELITFIADLGDRIFDFRDKLTEFFHDAWDTAEPVLTWLYEFTKDQLGETLSSLWETVQSLAEAVLEVAGALGGALWEAIKGVYDLFKALWDFLSPVLMPLLKIIAGIVGGVLVAAFVGLVGAVRVVAEIIEFAANIIQWVADNILAPLIGLVGSVASVFADVLVGAIVSLHMYFSDIFGAIAGIWDGFTDLLGLGKDFIVGVVFGGLQGGLDAVQGSFQTAVDAIGKIWDGLKELAAAPIRFIVNTVWNNGLLKAIGAVAKFTGMDAPDPIQIGFARGGILPGFSRMADGDDQLVPMRQGEGVLVSEALKDQRSRDLFLSANEAGKKGKTFAGFMSDYVAGYADGGIVGSLNSIMRQFYPGLSLTSHYRPGDSGYHGKNMAADFSNTGSGMPSNPEMQAAAAFMFGNYGDQLEQLIHNPARNIGSGMDVGDGFGYYGADTMAGHTDHIHLAALQPLVDPSGVVQMVPFDGESGGGFSIMGTVKKLWDAVVNKINPFPDDGSWFAQMPGAFLKNAAESLWSKITGKVGAGSYDGTGGISGDVESWREMAMDAMRRNGFDADNPAQVNAMLKQIQTESGGNPSIKQGIIDVNSGGNEALGLLQIIPGTFAAHRDPSLPNDRTDAWANMNAALRYYRSRYGDDLTTMWGQGHGYAEGGIVDLFTRDLGGWVPNGALVRNTSGRDELMLPPELSQAMSGFFSEYPEAAKMLADAAVSMETASEWLAQAADYSSDEGITARALTRGIFDLGIDLPGADIVTGFLDAEQAVWDSRARQLDHLDSLAAKEKALEEARKALDELNSSDGEMSKQDQRKLDDAQKAVEEAKANVAKADSEDKLANANEKLADSEEKLRRVREDLDDNAEESAKKHAEEINKANDAVAKAEADLVAAKKQQVADLDDLVVLSQGHVAGMQSQANSFADQLIGMGVDGALVSQGLGVVSGALGSLGAAVGPAGMSLGVLLDLVKSTISMVTMVVETIGEIIDMIHEARMAALQAVADAWKLVAEHASLVTEMQQNVASLQQDIVRGLNEQRVAEFALRVAQQDRLIAEAESAVAVAEAKLALDREIERGNIAAQLRLMGLHEDWDSYLSFQALASQGMLDQWSDAAIGALFTYEAARAKALQSELSARLDQIKAESALAEVTRQNARNQADLLKAQERLIKMSAEVAGVDLVGATATAQAADIITKMAELQKQMDSNLLGRAGSFLGLQGPWSNEYRGQQAQMDTFRSTLEVLFKDYGVSMSDGQLNQALDQMKWVTTTGGDPTAVLRQFFPQLVEAEKALQLNDALSPIWDVEDKKTSTERDVEDWLSEIDLFEKTQPLEEAIKGLDYTIGGLEDASKAWASSNEDLRGQYLGSAWAKYQAAKELGVDWKLDDSYATPDVRDQIIKEVHIHLNGAAMYTADQVDELINEILEGTNAKPVVHMDASTVADARRGVNA
ncbi:hypothetical protein CDES_07525 [Corynebacterium deserti GIMN1.010]|uniref:Uncharacterized protein n=1 Tax=Corynebacterium deserti GIMN1.010 TaxID=931089 RepID=A0A0M4CJH2_9CORY|nr:phage tail tape measure protein [Corynebacterium deserti]ALC05914.1 hypothetical protein CDES_07525 [Corynebacterium deserti GIMN1.010]